MKHVSAVQADLGYGPSIESSRPSWQSSREETMGDLATRTPVEEKVAAVFAAMSAIFGELWMRKYGEDDDALGTWASVLDDLSDRQVTGGIEMVRRSWEGEYPPTPARFRKWALDSVRPYDVVPEDRRIPALPAEDSVRESHMAQLKSMVGLAPKEGS